MKARSRVQPGATRRRVVSEPGHICHVSYCARLLQLSQHYCARHWLQMHVRDKEEHQKSYSGDCKHFPCLVSGIIALYRRS